MSDSRPVRVFYVTPGGSTGRGGMGRMAYYLTASFSRKPLAVECSVIDSYGPGSAALMPVYFIGAITRITIACITRRVDVIHLNMAHRGSSLRKLALLRLAKLFGVPAVLHLHGSKFEVFSKGLGPIARGLLISAMNTAATIVVIGSYWRRYLEDHLKIDPKKIRIVHNGVPNPEFSTLQATPGPPLIVCLGLLGKRKGTFDLITALASKRLAESDWKAVIAGNGDVEGIRREAVARGIALRVELPGWLEVEAARSLLRKATIFVLPSYNEGLPVSVLEAMAMHLPIIATPVGAIPDAIVSDVTGLLIPVGDTEALAGAIEKLLLDPTLREKLGHNAAKKFIAQFTIDSAADQIITIYREIFLRK